MSWGRRYHDSCSLRYTRFESITSDELDALEKASYHQHAATPADDAQPPWIPRLGNLGLGP
ncbi:hypothetical protein PLEOSDRAFT_160204 [Pleurotus ostreatus PC15]|uniref:Uncharacterized protein n=1 Tax=Pleurotus ostreatus (strain PC15) TaxID=1137138 RepID=A0A067NN66_PLEO1|nr:hypothetical protein PLEOSDRAFT_160204 [Pleurotus ostreatus PC15]